MAGLSYDLIDPLAAHTTFTFNPSSVFRPLSLPDHDTLLSHLLNMAVKNPDSLVSQAKTIVEGSKDFLESYRTMATNSEETTEVPITVNSREKRPGLGLKRAVKFTMQPLPSLPDPSLVPDLDIDKLRDPVEYFAAFERRENAIKELRRLRGEPLEEIDFNNLPPRPIRPSLLGKSATYVHYTFPSLSNNESVISSQEANDQNIMSSPREDAIPKTNSRSRSSREDAMPKTNSRSRSPRTRVSDVKPVMSKQLSELDELLSYDFEGLDQVDVQKLLQEKLNIKILDDIREPPLPPLPVFRRREYGSFIGTSPNMNDTIFHENKSSKASTSKPLPKSPLASISMMNKHISRLTPLKDPFLALDIDDVANNDPLVTSKDPHEFVRSSALGAEDTEVSGEILPSVATGNDSEERLNEIRQTFRTSTMENLFEAISPTNREESLEVLNEASAPVAVAVKDVNAINVPMEEGQIAVVQEFVGEEVFNEGSAGEKVSFNGGDDEMSEPLNIQGILIEKPDKKTDASFNNRHEEAEELIAPTQENIDEEIVNNGRKRKAKSKAVVSKEPKNNKKKKAEDALALPSNVDEKLRRHSLYGAGTKMEAGLRRSTRIRMRPLEFWKGERFLYGRVHDSLVSVIGVKYASPEKDGKNRVVKVKSFVSDKYKDMIDLAASH